MDVLLLGDSISAYMRGDFDIQDVHYRNKNESTSDSEKLKLYRAGYENYPTDWIREYCYQRLRDRNELDLYDVIVLQCGINDFLYQRYDEDFEKCTPQEIADKIMKFICLICIETGNKGILQSLYPFTQSEGHKEYFNDLTGDICFINEELKKKCKKLNITFIDMHSKLRDKNGDFDSRYSDDGIHPNEAGYQIVYNEINKAIKSKFSSKSSEPTSLGE